jgi:enoyl-CoA hydratase
MPRFRADGEEIRFGDGGVSLLSSDALRELASIVDSWAQPLLVFRLTRAGGADMAEMSRFTPAEAMEFSRLGQTLFAAIERLPCVTVAVIDGDCFGGALDLVLAFDLRYATPRSRFSHPGAKLGIVTGFGGTSRWRRALDGAAARRLFLASPVLSAGDALAAGLLDGLGEPDLGRLRALDPATTQMVKELTIHGARLSREELRLLAERLGTFYAKRQ